MSCKNKKDHNSLFAVQATWWRLYFKDVKAHAMPTILHAYNVKAYEWHHNGEPFSGYQRQNSQYSTPYS